MTSDEQNSQNLQSFLLPYNILMYKRLLVLATVLVVVLSACSNNQNVDSLQTGSVSFSVNSQSTAIATQSYPQAFSTAFLSVPSVAFALQSMTVNAANTPEWSVSGNPTRSMLTVNFLNVPSHWTSITVGYWATNRPDITVGSVAQSLNLNSGSATVTVAFPNQIANSGSSIVRAFITGWTRAGGDSIVIRAYDNGVTSAAVQMVVQVGGDMAITKVQLNFLIFSPSTAPFASYGGGINQNNFGSSKLYSLQKNIYRSPYTIYGLGSLIYSKSGPLGFNARMGSDFYLRLDALLAIDAISLTYVTIGTPTNKACSACAQLPVLYDNECISSAASCPAASFSLTYDDGTKACQTCPTSFGFVVNSGKTGCTCAQGLVLNNGFCLAPSASATSSFNTQVQYTTQGSISSGSTSSSSTAGPASSSSSSSSSSSGSSSSSSGSSSSGSASSSGQSSSSIPTVITAIPVRPITTTTIPSTPINQITAAPILPPTLPPNQSYIPVVPIPTQAPVQTVTTPILPQTLPTVPQAAYVSQDCSSQPNSYWSGYRCVCKVGFQNIGGSCVASTLTGGNIFRPSEFIYKISQLYSNNGNGPQPPVINCPANELAASGVCQCVSGYTRNSAGICVIAGPEPCPANSARIDNVCTCNSGYVKQGNVCVTQPCPSNSYSNGLGGCECNTGYYKYNNVCLQGQPCKLNSERNEAGQCQCLPGYTDYGTTCAKCPANQFWLESLSMCVITCGVNQVTNAQGNCQCQSGYAFYEGVCSICPSGFFILDGYCVECTIGSTHDVATNKCVCNAGLMMASNGICVDRCTNSNEVYEVASDSCKCFNGLGRVNGVCGICTNGYINANQICVAGCRTNQVLSGSVCQCAPGFGYNSAGACVDCSTVTGGFLLDGFCAICPGNQINLGNTCGCPSGKIIENGICKDACPAGQAADATGFCFTCPFFSKVVNGACQCDTGYILQDNACQVQCPTGQNIINGACAICVLNTVYSATLQACVCPPNFFMGNVGMCIPSSLAPVTCGSSQFYDSERGCQNCPSQCSQCSSALFCTACPLPGFVPSGNICVSKCGDGIRVTGEQCDDNNLFNGDGCSSTCTTESGYTCTGDQPSICSSNAPRCGDNLVNTANEQCDKGPSGGNGCTALCLASPGFTCANNVCTQVVPNPSSGLDLNSPIVINSGSVFVALKTPFEFTFANDSEKRSFIKYSFPDPATSPSSVFCVQSNSDTKVFQCLCIYASGVPNRAFDANFEYNFQGKTGFYRANIDPLSSPLSTRSLK